MVTGHGCPDDRCMDEHTNPHPGPEIIGTQPEIRRLTRRLDNRVVAGVASGLGEYFGVDPVLVRLAFIVAAIAWGTGILIYLVAWWLMPPAWGPQGPGSGRVPHGERLMQRLKGSPSWVGVAAVVLGVAIVANRASLWHGELVWGGALIALGVLLYHRSTTDRDVATIPSGPPQEAGSEPQMLDSGAAMQAAPPFQPPIVKAKRDRSPLGWITLGSVFLVVGVTALLQAAEVIHLAPDQLVALPLLVIGLGLLAGTFWGRARWLIAPGVFLVPFVLAASFIHVPFTGGFGDRSIRPQSVAQLRPAYRLVGGQMVLDLRDLPITEGTIRLEATAVAGRVLVIIPEGVEVDVHARAGMGEVSLFGQTYDGVTVDVQRTFASGGSLGRIALDLQASFGQVEVQR